MLIRLLKDEARMGHPRLARQIRTAQYAAAALIAMSAGSHADASAITDPIGDFLSTYTGARRPDLDIVNASLTQISPTTLSFSAQLAGDVTSGSGAHYVWVVNQGAGTEGLLAKTPPIGAGIAYDRSFDLFAYRVGSPFSPFNFQIVISINQPGAPSIALIAKGILSGSTIAFTAESRDLLLGQFVPPTLTWNMWTATDDIRGSSNSIADFAIEGRMLAVNAVPDPPTWSLLSLGSLALLWPRRTPLKTSRGTAADASYRWAV